MQAIIVNIIARQSATIFKINGKKIALVRTDSSNPGRYAVSFGVYANGNNMTYPEAIEYASDNISRVLCQFGIEVQFA